MKTVKILDVHIQTEKYLLETNAGNVDFLQRNQIEDALATILRQPVVKHAFNSVEANKQQSTTKTELSLSLTKIINDYVLAKSQLVIE